MDKISIDHQKPLEPCVTKVHLNEKQENIREIEPNDVEQFQKKLAKHSPEANKDAKDQLCLKKQQNTSIFSTKNKIHPAIKKHAEVLQSSLLKEETSLGAHNFSSKKTYFSAQKAHEIGKNNLEENINSNPQKLKKQATLASFEKSSVKNNLTASEKKMKNPYDAFSGIPFLQAASQETTTVQNLSSMQANRSHAAFLVQQIQQQVIDRILVSTDAFQGNRSVTVHLSPKLLENTEIQFTKQGTSLQIQFISDKKDSISFLQTHQVDLQTHLQSELKTYKSVEVQVRHPASTENSLPQEGRSRNRFAYQNNEEDEQ